MPFPQPVKVAAMVACERHCCLCHQFKGVKIECHHIIPEADHGANTFENCIPLCFDCHQEVEAYNPRHPRGTRYSADELKRRRDDWYEEIKNRRTLRDPVFPNNQTIELESFEKAREVAEANPTDKLNLRRGVVKGWEVLAKGLDKMSNVAGENFEPLGKDVLTALKKLSNSSRVPPELVNSILGLQHKANQAANHSHWGEYDPDVNAVLEFIQECERVRGELIGIYNLGGL